MKLLLYAALAAMLTISCKKESLVPDNNNPSLLTADAIIKKNQSETQMLIRAWTEWTYGRSVSVSPVSDPDGSSHFAGQPYASGTFLLAGASNGTLNPPVVHRTISLELNKYQYVFTPLINLSVWYNECDPSFQPAQNQSPSSFFQPFMSDAFDQNNNQLKLILDKTPIINTANQLEFRGSSGVWNFKLHPTQDNGCAAASTTISNDGYWALIKLSPGTHTIEFSGNFKLESYYDYLASNHVVYTINVK